MLLDRGANVNATRTMDNWSPLHFAVFNGLKNIVERLLGQNANANAKAQYKIESKNDLLYLSSPLSVARQQNESEFDPGWLFTPF